MSQSEGIISTLLGLPIFQAEWVLWLLIGISVISVGIMVERAVFYRRHKVNSEGLRPKLKTLLAAGDFKGASELLSAKDSMQTNVVLRGIEAAHLGPESVEDLLAGAARKETARYEKRLSVLATVAGNAPFVGLFGTVLGIIRAFKDLSGNMNEASDAVMAGIAEALIATAVGLLVAIPAVIAFNAFKGVVKGITNDMHVLAADLTASLKGAVPERAAVDEGV